MEALGQYVPCSVNNGHGVANWLVVGPNGEVVQVCSVGCVFAWASMERSKGQKGRVPDATLR